MGEEELRARAVLDEMQLRIAHGPYSALGLTDYASSEDVRAAFLQLTKQFHPARFGRMSTEVQKLSNEVFLGIKGAHDHLQRILGGASTRPGVGSASSSQAIPIATDAGAGTGKTPAPQLLRRTGQMPPLEQQRSGMRSHGTQPPNTNAHTQPLARGTDRSGQRPSTPAIPTRPGAPMNTPAHGMPRPATPPMNTPPHGMPRPATPPMNTPPHGMQRPGMPPRTTPASGIPIQRPTTPVGARPSTPQPTGTRPSTPQPGTRPTTPHGAQPPRPGADLNPGTIRGVQPASSAFDERSALRECMMLLNDRDWAGASQALHSLATRVPQSKSYRALLCYARGREAHAAGRPDEAHLEYQRALQLDPNLELVSQAIAELGRRR